MNLCWIGITDVDLTAVCLRCNETKQWREKLWSYIWVILFRSRSVSTSDRNYKNRNSRSEEEQTSWCVDGWINWATRRSRRPPSASASAAPAFTTRRHSVSRSPVTCTLNNSSSVLRILWATTPRSPSNVCPSKRSVQLLHFSLIFSRNGCMLTFGGCTISLVRSRFSIATRAALFQSFQLAERSSFVFWLLPISFWSTTLNDLCPLVLSFALAFVSQVLKVVGHFRFIFVIVL